MSHFDEVALLQARVCELEQRVAERTRELAVVRESAEAASRARHQFLARVSHEIRTPLGASASAVELLMGTRLDAEQQALVEAIGIGSETLLQLVDSVLDTTRIESGQLALASERCDLVRIVQDGANLFRAKAAKSGVEIHVGKGGEAATCVLGDAVRIRQIVHNLIGNAVRLTPSGRIDVGLCTASVGDERIAVTIQVTDTGVGIAPADHERVFEEFEQVDSQHVRQQGGSGLALSVARRLARMMDGEIWLESEVGQGSTFTFAMPALQADAPAAAVSPPIAVPLAGLRVLVVDDNVQNRMGAARMLAHEKCLVAGADSGASALAQLESRDFDLVLLDGQMPHMSGDEVAQRIRDPRSPVRNHSIPILGVTADAVDERLDLYLRAGMNLVLTKPYRKQRLLQFVAEVLARQGAPSSQ